MSPASGPIPAAPDNRHPGLHDPHYLTRRNALAAAARGQKTPFVFAAQSVDHLAATLAAFCERFDDEPTEGERRGDEGTPGADHPHASTGHAPQRH
ncbi:hypothetical protein [Streptomyces sp. HUAS TT7]|uniref:hypothetical protein n=1 Tax=Streptomyces sp. HUAS TT7 TaxID=3447507 RepID=UPI003F6588A3